MNGILKLIVSAVTLVAASHAAAQVNFYENEGFDGRAFSTDRQVGNFKSHGFNDRASSVVVVNNRWEVCEDAQFSGRCVVLRPGRYPSLSALGLNDRVLSVRMVSQNTRVADERYAPVAAPENGAIAVGWLWVSTFIRMCTSSSCARYTPTASGNRRLARLPCITAALSV